MDSGPHIAARQRKAWQIPEPKNLDPVEFKKVRDLIEAKVKAALAVI